jgi:hypothetical protein
VHRSAAASEAFPEPFHLPVFGIVIPRGGPCIEGVTTQ